MMDERTIFEASTGDAVTTSGMPEMKNEMWRFNEKT